MVANYDDILRLAPGSPILENVKQIILPGVVNSRITRLVLPKRIADELQLTVDGEVIVRYADHRQEKRPRVSAVWIELYGRHSIVSAVVEQDRSDALIGWMVLQELDILVDCTTKTLYPRHLNTIMTEIE